MERVAATTASRELQVSWCDRTARFWFSFFFPGAKQTILFYKSLFSLAKMSFISSVFQVITRKLHTFFSLFFFPFFFCCCRMQFASRIKDTAAFPGWTEVILSTVPVLYLGNATVEGGDVVDGVPVHSFTFRNLGVENKCVRPPDGIKQSWVTPMAMEFRTVHWKSVLTALLLYFHEGEGFICDLKLTNWPGMSVITEQSLMGASGLLFGTLEHLASKK